MGQRARHYKALMRKNWIMWRRTWVSSLCELICPVALMVILALARFAVDIEQVVEKSSFDKAKAYYPVYDINVTRSNYTQSMWNTEYTDNIASRYSSFYDFSKLNITTNNTVLAFVLNQCLPKQLDRAKNIIAMAQNTSIAWDVAMQLQTLVAQQKDLLFAFQMQGGSQGLRKIAALVPPIELQYKVFGSEQKIRDYLLEPNYLLDDDHMGICFGFSVEEKASDDYEIKLIFNDQYQDIESQTVPFQGFLSWNNYTSRQDELSFDSYTSYGFSHLQNWFANAVLKKVLNNANATIALSTIPSRTPAYNKDNFSLVLSMMLPFFMLIMYILPVYRTLQRILSEKESKARESMKMMGLNDFSYWISWMTYYFIVVTIISILCVIILSFNVIEYSSRPIVFLYFWIYGVSLFGMIMFFAAVFQGSRSGSIAGTLIYFGTSFIDSIISDQAISESSKIAASIFSTVAVSRGANNFGILESNGLGLNQNNMSMLIENYKFQNALIMMAACFFVFLLLGLYLDNVLPSQFGIRKPFYFFLTKGYWFGATDKNAKIENGINDSEKYDYLEQKSLRPENFEPPSDENKKKEKDRKILKINELRKTFDNGFQAVKGLNVKIYNGEIFALLGHNGAGKTTTISMLTGLIQSSSGVADVFGIDLFNKMNDVRQFMGVCPQHDVLFDLLTPREHLEIFCDFKGVDSKTKKQEIEDMLKEVDLTGFPSTVAKNLSGGSRRKLSVAIALIGGSKFVLLDEPTAGMDLTARRRLWNMLEKQKKNRIIILTTHYMDEADILGDRIGIMADGQLICLGSSLFLKNRFGVGYKITMVKKTKENNTKVEPYLQQKLGEIKLLSEVSSEITFQIPTNLSFKFKNFFEEFDHKLDELGIRSYGISITTLEEVFLRVGHGLENEDTSGKESNSKVLDEVQNLELLVKGNQDNEDDSYSIAEQHETGVCNIFTIHLIALFRKRFFISKKNIKGFIIEILIPIILVIIGFSFSKVQIFYDSPAKLLEPSIFPLKQRILVNKDLVRKDINSAFNIDPETLINLLPDFENSFDPTFKDYSSVIHNSTTEYSLLESLDKDIFNARTVQPEFPYTYGSYFIYEANNRTKQFKVATFVNITSQDVTALYPQFIYEAILKAATGNKNFKFKVVNSPFPVTAKLRDREAARNGTFIVFVIAIGFSLIPASIISFIILEKEKNLRHMQLISGMKLSSFWISNYIFDITKALIPMGIVVGLMYAYNLDYANVWILFLLYPIGVVPFTYATSFLFQSENIAQTVTMFLHFVFSGIAGIIVYVLRIIPSTKSVGDLLNWIMKIIPSFPLANSIMYASGKGTLKWLRPDLPQEDFNLNLIGGDILLCCVHFIVWTLVVIILEAGMLGCLRRTCRFKSSIKPKQDLELDEDVLEEEERVKKFMHQRHSLNMSQNMVNAPNQESMQVCVNGFRKVYTGLFQKPFLAVERTSFGLDFGECFALLGINGAGKTTTFKSLTNDIDPTSGELRIGGMDIKKDFNQIRKLIGYCPQHDCIFDMMTVEEHLDFYARIKGIKKDRRERIIEKQIKDMNLEEHRKKPAGTLSGGNKRKLSVAMAILGNPPIILLDEPSAGMDPQARRFMWSIVAKISQQRKQSAVILTTHSMEEAEALSTKMGIMVKGGVFKCFGSSQHIKNKYGTGFEIEVKIRKITPNDLDQMQQLLMIPKTDEKISLQKCIELMRNKGINEMLVQELTFGGLGEEIYNESLENKQSLVTVKSFLTWLNIQLHGLTIIISLVNDFNQVELLEHYNDYYKFRVPRLNKSIGYVFGMIEDKKENYGISEYSVGQTTLEQIFQTFANQQIDHDSSIVFEKNSLGQMVRKNKSNVVVRGNSLKFQ